MHNVFVPWATFTLLAAAAGVQAQEDELRTRQLWDDAFRQKRAETRAEAPRPSPAASARTRPAASASARPAAVADQLVGLTLWQLRPVRSEAEAAAALVWSTGDVRLAAQRVEAGTPFPPESRVRLAIESGRSGYLYLIDRERYADGTLGDPYLVFPRVQIRGGDNHVGAGRVIEIPDLGDRPPFYTLKQSRPDHVGEVLSVLVSEEPLPGLAPVRAALRLEPSQVADWERRYAVPVRRLEAKGTAGALYTPAEREAGGMGARLLTYEEPLPQTLFHVPAPPGQPLWLSFDLGIQR